MSQRWTRCGSGKEDWVVQASFQAEGARASVEDTARRAGACCSAGCSTARTGYVPVVIDKAPLPQQCDVEALDVHDGHVVVEHVHHGRQVVGQLLLHQRLVSQEHGVPQTLPQLDAVVHGDGLLGLHEHLHALQALLAGLPVRAAQQAAEPVLVHVLHCPSGDIDALHWVGLQQRSGFVAANQLLIADLRLSQATQKLSFD